VVNLYHPIDPASCKERCGKRQVSRELNDVAARVHSFTGLLSKFFAVSLPFLALNIATPFRQKCARPNCLTPEVAYKSRQQEPIS
jgi:hypothetical protein